MTDSEAVVIDMQAHARRQEWGGPKLLVEMLRLFLDNAPVRVQQVRQGLSGGSLADAERGVHSLKSSAANVGAVTVSRIAAEMDDLASGGDAAGMTTLLPELEAAFGLVQEQLAATLAGMESDE